MVVAVRVVKVMTLFTLFGLITFLSLALMVTRRSISFIMSFPQLIETIAGIFTNKLPEPQADGNLFELPPE